MRLWAIVTFVCNQMLLLYCKNIQSLHLDYKDNILSTALALSVCQN